MVFNPSLKWTSNCQDSWARWPMASEPKLVGWDLGQLLLHPISNHFSDYFANLVKKEKAPVIVRFCLLPFLNRLSTTASLQNCGAFPGSSQISMKIFVRGLRIFFSSSLRRSPVIWLSPGVFPVLMYIKACSTSAPLKNPLSAPGSDLWDTCNWAVPNKWCSPLHKVFFCSFNQTLFEKSSWYDEQQLKKN